MNRFSKELRTRGAAALVAVLASTGALSAQATFTDISVSAGLSGVTYHSTTNHSLGVNWLDYNHDDLPDLFLVGGNAANGVRLYRNNGDQTFTDVSSLVPSLPAYETSGSLFADFDNDGDHDIFIYTDNEVLDPKANPADGPPALFLKNLWSENGERILEGQPLFVEASAQCGLEDLAETPLGPMPGLRSKTAAWLDYDRDGCLDLYVGHWVMNGGAGEPGNADRLYRNRCDGTFEDVTAAAGLDPEGVADNYRPTLAVLAAHLDDDLWPDLWAVHASNDGQPLINDFYWQNNGDGTFTERTVSMPGIGNDDQAGMGLDTADIDGDGDWDLYISDLRFTNQDELPKGNVLYLNNGDGSFQDNSAVEAGVQGHNSWAVNFFDMDLDGDDDLFVGPTSSAEFEMLYENDGTGNFTNVAGPAGIATTNVRGAGTADFDGDGDLDLAVINQGGELQLFRNDTPAAGNWLQIELAGVRSNRDAIGAVVTATVGSQIFRRQVKGGVSTHSQDSPVVHFGLGATDFVDELRIEWPSGSVDRLTSVPTDQRLDLTEESTAFSAVAINAGGTDTYDDEGRALIDDRRFRSGGYGYFRGWRKEFDVEVAGTTADALYRTLHTRSSFSYRFDDLASGEYAIDFHFMEPIFTEPGQRTFDVTVEGVRVLENFDIVERAGGRRIAHRETVTATVNDGRMEIDFEVTTGGKAVVSGIAIRRMVQFVNAGGDWFETELSGVAVADRPWRTGSFGYHQGWSAAFPDDIVGTADDPLYATMHTRSSFAYRFEALPSGSYDVTLYFTEPFHEAKGGRLMDIYAEGVPVLENVDVFLEAGGRFLPWSTTVPVQVTDGRLDLDFAIVGGGKAIVSGIKVEAVQLD